MPPAVPYPVLSIRHWLAAGWRDYRATAAISSAFSLLFTGIGMAAFWLLLRHDLALLLFPLFGGFVLVAPILVTGYQRAARLLRQGQTPRFADLLRGITEGTPGIWFLTFLLGLGYLIWITDALIIYGIYFGQRTLTLDGALLDDAQLRADLFAYLFYGGLLGFGMAAMSFVIAVFGIPLILHRRLGFIHAINRSVITVFRHPALMLRWALTLALLTLLTLIIALPLLLVVLPVLGYASHAAYAALFPDDAPVE
ncbi:MAG: DUF2189 domain-containing protein [Thiohalomonadaceae bacterium]